jgi:ribosomal protein L11 methyltransferase
MDTSWWEMHGLVTHEQGEALGALLMEGGALGVEERPGPDEQTLLVAYYSIQSTPEERLDVEALIRNFEGHSIEWKLCKDDGWATRWQQYFKPLPVGERLVICPSWEEYDNVENRLILELDPGMAFGTGQHATTRGCLIFLERLLTPGQPLLDVGCGSGILSVASILLGASQAVGVDIDDGSVMVATENAEKNGVDDKCSFSTTDISEVDSVYPFVVANIQAHILNPMVRDLSARVQSDGILLLSGILEDQVSKVMDVYSTEGWSLQEQWQEGEWCTLYLLRS